MTKRSFYTSDLWPYFKLSISLSYKNNYVINYVFSLTGSNKSLKVLTAFIKLEKLFKVEKHII